MHKLRFKSKAFRLYLQDVNLWSLFRNSVKQKEIDRVPICGGTDVKGKIIPKCFSGKFKKNKGSKPGGFLRNLPGNKEYF